MARFGVLAFRPKPETHERWQPLVDYLNATPLPQKIVLEVFTYQELETAVRNKQVDVVLTQPAHYTILASRENLYSPLATLQEQESGHILSSFGGTILTRADRDDIRELKDLKGKRIALTSKSSLGGYQAQAMELLQAGIKLPDDAHLMESFAQQDLAINAVLDGTAEVAFIRSGVMESMVREGKLDPTRLKMLKSANTPEYPLALSTRLYPQWALAAMPWTAEDLSRRIAAAVLGLPHDGPVARAAHIHGFTVPGNYQSVEQTMRALRVPPFESAGFSFGDVWERYHWAMIFVLLAFLLVIMLTLRLAQARLAQRKAMARLHDAQRIAQVGSWELDLATNRLLWSDEIFRIFEIDPTRFRATYEGFLNTIHPDDRAAVKSAYEASLIHRQPYAIEHRLMFPDGRIKFVHEQCETSFDTAGRPLRSTGTVQDITARKDAELALHEAEARAGIYIDHAPQGIFVADATGRYINVNPAACELVGYSREELLGGMGIIDIAGTADLGPYLAMFSEIQRTGQGHFDIPLRRKDGTLITVALHATVLPNQDVIGFALDVTEQRAIQGALAALASTLAPLTDNAYFQAACRYLCQALSLDHVFVGKLTDDRSGVQVLAGWSRDRPMAPMAYSLADTPCANLVASGHCLHPSGVQTLYPKDDLLIQMGIEAYIGAPLFDKHQATKGILVGLSTRPIHQRILAQQLFGVFVDSVSAEMSRNDIERVLRESDDRFTAFMNALPGAAFMKDDAGHVLWGNAKMQQILGQSDLAQRATGEFFPPAEAGRMLADDLRALHEGHRVVEETLRLPDGRSATFETHKFSIPRKDTRALLGGIAFDISARKQAEHAMREALAVFNASNQGITTTDAQGTILSVNPSFCRITGYAPEEVIGKTPALFKSGRHDAVFYEAMWSSLKADGVWEGEIWNRRRNGQIYPEWLTISSIKDAAGQVVEYVALFNDITERKQYEENMWRQANFDALTGLANRNLFSDRLERSLRQARRNGSKVGLAFLDLDGFKWINDTLGHDMGDQLLLEMANRLQQTVREQDTVARLGGDEFTVVIQDLEAAEAMLAIGDKLVNVLRDPVLLNGTHHQISGSVGITIYPDDGEDVQTLIKNADIAMYKAKQAGKNRFQFYARHMQVDAQERMQMEADLRLAIEQRQFVLHYQPIVDADSGELLGAEALIRWQHPVKGMVSPLDFIPVAEDCGLIVPIGEWVLHSAAAQWKIWRNMGYAPLRLSVNVSSIQFREPALHTLIAHLLRDHGIPPGYLVLEITESILMDGSLEAEARMRDIKNLGIRYSLDDFGTGYSSLSYLKRFPVDVVKIDRSFIRDCPEDRSDAHLVEAIITMAHSLDLLVTAEGVETEAQLDFLRNLGCDTLQGYLIDRPLPPDAFEILIQRRQLLLPTDGASVEESRFLAALRHDRMDVEDWLNRLLGEQDKELAAFARAERWVFAGLDLRQAVEAHLQWRRRLDKLINGQPEDLTVEEASSPLHCKLGNWMAGHPDPDASCFKRLDEDHRIFHRIAGQIAEDFHAGHRSIARQTLGGVAFRKASRDVVTALIACYRQLIAKDHNSDHNSDYGPTR